MSYNAYEKDGVARVSVTSVLRDMFAKPGLTHWIKEQTAKAAISLCVDAARAGELEIHQDEILKAAILKADEIRDAAGAFGTSVHGAIECTMRGGQLEVSSLTPEVQARFNSWIEWKSQHTFNPKFLEMEVISEKYGYAGTLDYVGEYDGKMSIIDWKTNKTMDKEAAPLQLAAYWVALKEMSGEECPGIYVCHVGPDEVKMYDFSADLDEYVKNWLRLYAVWTWLHRTSRKFKPIIKNAINNLNEVV